MTKTETAKREWVWEQIPGRRWVARVMPRGRDILRLNGNGIKDWSTFKHKCFGRGTFLHMTIPDGVVLYECVRSGTAEFAEFVLVQEKAS